MSLITLRGSTPIIWTYVDDIRLENSFSIDQNQSALKQHFNLLLRHYPVMWVKNHKFEQNIVILQPDSVSIIGGNSEIVLFLTD